MRFFVYIIYSKGFDKYYKGFSENPQQRLLTHNLEKSRYTSKFVPWTLVYLECFELKKDALIREKSLKKYSKSQLLELISSSKNELNKD